jgi:hypothetical protein
MVTKGVYHIHLKKKKLLNEGQFPGSVGFSAKEES